MTDIKEGGQLVKLEEKVLKTIEIRVEEPTSRTAQIWINGESLSYVSIAELMDIKEEITEALKELIL